MLISSLAMFFYPSSRNTYNKFQDLSVGYKNQTTLPRDQPGAGSEMKPLTYDRGYDNVLLGQGYRTPRGAVIDEYGAVVER
jgi:hypothetical protein